MGQSYLPEPPGLTLSVKARRWLFAGVVCLVLLALALGVWVGRSIARLDEQYLLALETMREAYEARLAVTQRELTDSRLAYDVEKQTLATLREDLRVSHEESVALREEVTFYRSLMAPDRVAKGLQIAEFEANEQADGGFSFHLLLTQVASRRTWVSGTVEVELAGSEGSKAVLPLTEIASPSQYPLPYRFRYFQELTGRFTLPAGFEPEEVRVRVQPRRGDPVEKAFPWQAG